MPKHDHPAGRTIGSTGDEVDIEESILAGADDHGPALKCRVKQQFLLRFSFVV